MASVPAGRQRLSSRTEAGRFLALVGATGLAICQPVLDTFGKSPETVVFRRADWSDLLAFALLVALVPPVVLWGGGFTLGRLDPRRRQLVHGATVGALAALAVVQVGGSWVRPLALATALAVGFATWVLVVRVSHARLWFQLLAVLPLASVLLFLTASRASDAVSAGGFDAVSRAPGAGAPIVLIVLDELPTASLLDERGRIDPVRFPNLARLADEATWYRNHTATSGWTATAVPAIFSGQLPENDTSLFTERPDNIFRLLEGSHDLVVSEAVTRLCPIETCGATPISPAAAGPPPRVAGDLRGLLGDAIDVWGWRVTGSTAREPLAGFQEQLTTVSSPAATASEPADTEEAPPVDLEPGRQPVRVGAFLDAIEPGDRPTAAIIHLVLPHSPWRFLPDGTVYTAPGAAGGEQAHPNQWVADVRRQQHLLQASYADRLVGQILDRVREAGFYDEAVVAVAADHGIAFPVGDLGRRHSAENEVEIMWAPLLVKAPHQTRGVTDDSNLQNIDILPTIASLAGIEIPWDLPGAAAGSQAIADRGDRKEYHRHESILEPGPTVVLEVDGAAGLRALLRKPFAPVAADEDPVRGLYRLGPRPELLDEPFTTTRRAPADVVEVDDRDRVSRGVEPVVVVSGTVHDQPGASEVVAVVDGIIVAVSPIYDDDGRRFLLMLPVAPPIDPGRVRLGLVSESGELIDAGPLTA